MIVTYVVYDERNVKVASYAGPYRLALWNDLPAGWSIERFQGDVSQGCVSLADVRKHALEMKLASIL